MITRPWEKNENRILRFFLFWKKSTQKESKWLYSEAAAGFMQNDYLQSSALWHLSKQMNQIRSLQTGLNRTEPGLSTSQTIHQQQQQPDNQLRAGDKRKLSVDGDKKKVYSWLCCLLKTPLMRKIIVSIFKIHCAF